LTLGRPETYTRRTVALGEERLRSIVESLLLISADPVPVARLVEVIRIEDPQTEEDTIRAAIGSLVEHYANAERPLARGFRVDEVAGGLQYRTTPENAQYVRRYLAAKPQRLTKAALETLAIIAYRQPVTKPEVEAIRGVDVGAALKGLLERDLIKILGKRDEVGRPIIYGTTTAFLEFFGLKALGELPTLREYHELDDEHQKEVDALGGEEKQSVADLAAAASFLVERREDPELDALDAAVADVDRVKKTADDALDPPKPEGAEGAPGSDGANGPEGPEGAAPSAAEDAAPERVAQEAAPASADDGAAPEGADDGAARESAAPEAPAAPTES
jgi:segregation and condensation protein B